MAEPYFFYFLHCAFDEKENNNSTLSAENKQRRNRRTPRCCVSWGTNHLHSNTFLIQEMIRGCSTVVVLITEYFMSCWISLNLYSSSTRHIIVMVGLWLRIKNSQGTGGSTHGMKEWGGCNWLSWLGLVLVQNSRLCSKRHGNGIFGMTSSPLYLWLKFSCRILLTALQNHPSAKKNHQAVTKLKNTSKQSATSTKIFVRWEFGALQMDWKYNCRDQETGPYRDSTSMARWTTPVSIVSLCSHLMAKSAYVFSIVLVLGTRVPLQNMEYKGMKRVWNLHGARIVVDQAFRVADKPYLIRRQQQDSDGPGWIAMQFRFVSCRSEGWEWSKDRLKDKMDYEVCGER